MTENLPRTVAEAEEREWGAVAELMDYTGPKPEGLELAPERLLASALHHRRWDRKRELKKHIRYLSADEARLWFFPPASLYALLHGWDPRVSKVRDRRERFEEELEQVNDDLDLIREATRFGGKNE